MRELLNIYIDSDECIFHVVREDDGLIYWVSVATGELAESDGPFDTAADALAALLAK